VAVSASAITLWIPGAILLVVLLLFLIYYISS
jgi:hypothetical protein